LSPGIDRMRVAAVCLDPQIAASFSIWHLLAWQNVERCVFCRNAVCNDIHAVNAKPTTDP
jgi:hypothetical protein